MRSAWTSLSFVRSSAVAVALVALVEPSLAHAGDLVRGVRGKLSAGDLASGEAAVERYRAETGVDKEYLDAVGWLARGAEMLGKREKAAAWVAELRREIPAEKDDLTIALGAAIEVEGRLRAASEGRGAALRFLEKELAAAKDPAFRSRISKNINLLGLEGQKAPEIGAQEVLGKKTRLSDLAGKPVLLFFWANWCGDCKAESPKLARLQAKYGPKGLAMLAPTRFYGEVDGKPATPAAEKDVVAKVWAETYPGLSGVSVPIDTETMVRYGASATPTYALVDRKGIVRLYAPTRLTEAELSRRIEELLAEKD